MMMKYIRGVLFAFIAIYLLIIVVDWVNGSFSDLREEALAAREKHDVKSRYIILVDYSQSILSTRLCVYDTKINEIILSSRVSHAWNTGFLYASDYSNTEGSNKSTYGSFATGGEYQGKFGRSMRVHGLDSNNSNTMSRAIVFHAKQSFWTVFTGWSLGCFMTSPSDNDKIIDLTQNGTFIYVKQ